MKKLILLLIMSPLFASSQTINDVKLKDIETDYIQIVGVSKLLSSKVNITVDFGQRVKAFGGMKQVQLKDENGEKIEFNSMVDALNFFTKYGFEFVTAYALSVGDSQDVYHFLLRKKKA